jgi:hypothetical protein
MAASGGGDGAGSCFAAVRGGHCRHGSGVSFGPHCRKGTHIMTLLIVLLLLALVFGGIGLLVEAAAWAFIIAVALLIAGAIAGFVGRSRSAA